MDSEVRLCAAEVREPGDADVITASGSEPERFGLIFERHFATIHRYIARRLSPTLADDLAAQVFTIAFERRRNFDATATDARPWLYGIASNLIRNNRRAERRLLAALARVERQSHESDGLDAYAGVDPGERTRIARAIAQLRPDQRDVLLLYCWADLSHAEIAAALGVPAGTVASRLARARRHLRASLGNAENNTPTVTSKEE